MTGRAREEMMKAVSMEWKSLKKSVCAVHT